MKKRRCPVCGKECVTLRNIFRCYALHDKYSYIRDRDGGKCPECGGLFLPYPKPGVGRYIAQAAVGAIIIASVLLAVFVSSVYLLIMFPLFFLIPLVILPLISAKEPLVRFKRGDYTDYREYIIPKPNARVIMKRGSGEINDLDIFGLRFDEKTRAARFREAFTDGLVPAVFHKGRKKRECEPEIVLNEGELEVTIMDMKFIPEDLLFCGSGFTVMDNGKEIASGLIVSVYEQAEAEE